jgi:hypothetical protein
VRSRRSWYVVTIRKSKELSKGAIDSQYDSELLEEGELAERVDERIRAGFYFKTARWTLRLLVPNLVHPFPKHPFYVALLRQALLESLEGIGQMLIRARVGASSGEGLANQVERSANF